MDDTGLSQHIPTNLALILFHMKVHDIFGCILNVPYYRDNFNSGADVSVTLRHGKKTLQIIHVTDSKLWSAYKSVVIAPLSSIKDH